MFHVSEWLLLWLDVVVVVVVVVVMVILLIILGEKNPTDNSLAHVCEQSESMQ